MNRSLFKIPHGALFTLATFVLGALTSMVALPANAQEAESEVRVMSFNIRHGKAKDGDNIWDNRKDLVATTIGEFKPDILGMQEVVTFQASFLSQRYPEYSVFTRTREKTGEEGEHCSIFYRTERFKKLGGGHFWLSHTPKVPGSKSWDSSLPRMVSWLCLRDAQQPDRPICVFNTHFDHRGSKARDQSAKLIAARSRAIAKSFGDARVIVMGDFNTDEGTAPYQRFFTKAKEEGEKENLAADAAAAADTETIEGVVEQEEEAVLTFVDTYRATHEAEKKTEGTFNGFTGKNEGARIDWILVDQRWSVESASIVDRNENGRYPSDHFPVTAVLR